MGTMIKAISEYLSIAFSREICTTSLKVSLIVGTLLVLINHGAAVFDSSVTTENVWQIALTYLVPFCVSTYSSVKVLRNNL